VFSVRALPLTKLFEVEDVAVFNYKTPAHLIRDTRQAIALSHPPRAHPAMPCKLRSVVHQLAIGLLELHHKQIVESPVTGIGEGLNRRRALPSIDLMWIPDIPLTRHNYAATFRRISPRLPIRSTFGLHP